MQRCHERNFLALVFELLSKVHVAALADCWKLVLKNEKIKCFNSLALMVDSHQGPIFQKKYKKALENVLSSKHDTKEVLMKIRNFSLDCPNFWRISFNFRELTKVFIEKALKTSSKWKIAINMNKPGTFQVGAGARKVKISIRFLFFEKS